MASDWRPGKLIGHDVIFPPTVRNMNPKMLDYGQETKYLSGLFLLRIDELKRIMICDNRDIGTLKLVALLLKSQDDSEKLALLS